MSLLGAITNVVSMPIRVAVDVVMFPKRLMDGEHLLPNTDRGISRIEEELED